MSLLSSNHPFTEIRVLLQQWLISVWFSSANTWENSLLGKGSQSGSYTGAVTNTALSSPLLTVVSGYTHPSYDRAAGNMAITFSPVELYFPGQPHAQRCWCSLWMFFLMARILKMCLVAPTWKDVHLYCVGKWEDTWGWCAGIALSRADGISLNLG